MLSPLDIFQMDTCNNYSQQIISHSFNILWSEMFIFIWNLFLFSFCVDLTTYVRLTICAKCMFENEIITCKLFCPICVNKIQIWKNNSNKQQWQQRNDCLIAKLFINSKIYVVLKSQCKHQTKIQKICERQIDGKKIG